MHASIVVETMDTIIVMILVTRIVLQRTQLSLKKEGTILQVAVSMVEDILIVVSIIRAMTVMNGTSLK